jgi:GNAT superfamily N-acetyltransferase
MTPEVWGPERIKDLTALWNLSAPDEPLTADELAGVCFDDPGVVLATPDGAGVVAVVVRRHQRPAQRTHTPTVAAHAVAVAVAEPDDGQSSGDAMVVGHVRLVTVHPESRRRGLGAWLVRAAEQWMVAQGASVSVLAAEAPIYLWPGVDASNIAAQCLAESTGYRSTGSEINMALTSAFRAPAPDAVVVRRLTDDRDVAAARSLVEATWPQWLVEFDLGVAAACAHGAFVSAVGPDADNDPVAVGFCAHSVLRTGWLGPVGIDLSCQNRGVGSALVSAAATDVMVAGLADVEISWVGPVRFYAKLGARRSRSFRSYTKVLAPGDADESAGA